MKRITASFVASLLLLPAAAAAQDAPVPLTVGRAHADAVAAGESDTYTLELGAGSFVRGVVRQTGADVRVTISGPAGARLGRVDALASGEERFHFDADSAGTYELVVEPVDDAAGAYAIEVQRVEPIATDPERRADQLMAGFDGEEPGGVVAVIRDGEIVFSKAYGMADLTQGVPFALDTRTNIGSTSKQFTGFALALLEQRGALSLDDDVRKYIPGLPDFGPTVTIRNLLTHTTGYREYINTLVMAGLRMDEGDYIDRSEIISVVQRQPELQNQPNAEFNYNNTAFALATMVVDSVTGRPFARWIEENVFRPLGMHDTRFRAHPREIVPRRSIGYSPHKQEGWREARDLGASMGAGGVYTTVADLARWIDNFDTGRLGGPGMFEVMTTRNVLTDGDTTSYGLGLFIDEYRGLTRVHHGGADVAHRSMLRYFPEIDAGVVALSNNARFNSNRIADELADLFFAEHFRDPADEAVMAGGDDDDAFDPEDYDPEDFDDYAGRYALEEAPAVIVRFYRDGDRLLTEVPGQNALELVPTSDSTFTIKGIEGALTFHRGPRGQAASVTLHQNGDHRANRLEGSAWEPSAAELEAYTGRFYSAELETYYDIVIDGDELVIRQRRFGDAVTLEPGQKKDSFSGGFPVADAEFVRDSSGKVVAVLVGNGRARGIRFERVD